MGGTPATRKDVGGEEKWRWDGTGAPEGRLGEGKGSHARREKGGDHWEGRGSKGSVARFPLPIWAPRNLLRPQAWSSAHLGPLQPRRSWGSGREERGSKSKGQTYRTSTPEGRLGVGRSSYTWQDPPTVRGPAAWGRPSRGGGMEGSMASAFPAHLGTREPVELPGLILCPQSLPPATQSPSPAPTPTCRALPLHVVLGTQRPPLRPPPTVLGLNPTETP